MIDVSSPFVDGLSSSIAPPNPGWIISGGGGDASDGGNGGITHSPAAVIMLGAQYANSYGPFSGSFNAVVDNEWFLSQEFYCSSTASVSVSFFWSWCGGTEAADYTVMYLNDIEQPNTRIIGTNSNWDGSIPTNIDDQLVDASGCTSGWNYQAIGYDTNSIARVNMSETFKVSFEFALSANNEWASVSGINIRCTQIPTSSPTVEPTTQPNNLPSSRSTDQPSSNPSITPTIHPSYNPALSPSNTPSSHPTTGTTTIPSDSPSFVPSTTPSISPSGLPSYTPSISSTEPQTSQTSETPTEIPSKWPSLGTLTPSPITTAPTTNQPTSNPTPLIIPTEPASDNPSTSPSIILSKSPSIVPSHPPTDQPTVMPTIITANISDIDNIDKYPHGPHQPSTHKDIFLDIDNKVVIYSSVSLAAVCCLMVILLFICCQKEKHKHKHSAVNLSVKHRKIEQSTPITPITPNIPIMLNIQSATVNDDENHQLNIITPSKAVAGTLPDIPNSPTAGVGSLLETDNDITDVEEMYNLIKMDEIEMEIEGDNITTMGHDNEEDIDDWTVEDVIEWITTSTNEILRNHVNVVYVGNVCSDNGWHHCGLVCWWM